MNETTLQPQQVTETNWFNLIVGLMTFSMSMACLYTFVTISFGLKWHFSNILVRDIPTATTALLAFGVMLIITVLAFQNSKSTRTEWR